MNRFILLATGLVISGVLRGQSPLKRYSARLGVDLTTLDAPDDINPRYIARLARHLRQDRIIIAAEAGYMHITTTNQLFNTIDPGPNRRERFTTELSVLVDALSSPHHALRLCGGLSAWYRRDDLYRGASTLGGGSYAIDRRLQRGLTTGWHLAAEYAWQFDERWSVDGRFRVSSLQEAGVSSALGTGISYHF
ncbi:hypothetical protein [Spirosoma validum]|uniref:Uncharacterized protein n=1 Tax=Spirosoma validum TaxID=2771355 RepID=A0A927B9U3_9BACT|nr:hypothetical protein [Spirosoma validum]MBD2757767.1 hypothetical protein [Spirosoma validum]